MCCICHTYMVYIEDNSYIHTYMHLDLGLSMSEGRKRRTSRGLCDDEALGAAAAAGSLRGLALGVRALGGPRALTGIVGDRARGGCARLGLGWGHRKGAEDG